MKRYCQRNPEWNSVHLNGTYDSPKTTIGAIGCTITSVCMLHSDFYPRNALTPPEAAAMFKFTRGGLLRWADTEFPGMLFIERGYGYDKEKIKKYAKSKDLGVIVEVNKNHWCAVWRWSIFGPILFDPIDGKIYWGIPRKYKITGFATFQKLD